MTPGIVFSIPGMSQAELLAQLDKFRTPVLPKAPSASPMAMLTPPALPVAPAVSPVKLTGVKRGTSPAIDGLGKRLRGDADSLAVIPFEMPYEPELALGHVDGKIVVSPSKKRKIGRPPGSKNRPKTPVVGEPSSVGPR